MSNKIPSIEKTLTKESFKVYNESKSWGDNMDTVVLLNEAIEIAKRLAARYVKEALETAAEKATTLHVGNGMYLVDKNSIINAYPKELIK